MAKEGFSDVSLGVGRGHYRSLTCTEAPALNVVEKNEFLTRVKTIFGTYNDILKKTLGAYGSPTIIANYPYKDVTKDGFTVCRNLEFDIGESCELDKVIGGFIKDICGKLNYAVGDGTTSAIVATNKIFQELFPDPHSGNCVVVNGKRIRPKDFMEIYDSIKDEIIEKLEAETTPITSENLIDIIEKIVSISTNGDQRLVDGITKAYREIGFPSIVCEKSEGLDTYCDISDGFQLNAQLADKLYVNTENMTGDYKDADVIIFGVKVTGNDYAKIIKPLNDISRKCGRKLVCLAPWFDEVALNGTIKRDILAEYQATGTANLILVNYFNSTKAALESISDLAMILGTTVVDRTMEMDLIEKYNDTDGELISYINCFDRGIDGIGILQNNADTTLVRCSNNFVNEDRKNGCIYTLGFTDSCSLGFKKKSIFNNSHYDKNMYDLAVADAKTSLDAAIEKFKELGTYTRDVYDAQKRYCSLRMKMATLYVGGESDLSRNMFKDSADDAIRAAESAYQYGYIKGCNLTLIQIVHDMLVDETDAVRYFILSAIGKGFMNVYIEVMNNAFPASDDGTGYDNIPADRFSKGSDVKASARSIASELKDYEINIPEDYLTELIVKYINSDNILFADSKMKNSISVAELMVYISIIDGRVFDLATMDFTNDVINSMKTDAEILSATTELLSIMEIGNQVVMASWNHKKYQY